MKGLFSRNELSLDIEAVRFVSRRVNDVSRVVEFVCWKRGKMLKATGLARLCEVEKLSPSTKRCCFLASREPQSPFILVPPRTRPWHPRILQGAPHCSVPSASVLWSVATGRDRFWPVVSALPIVWVGGGGARPGNLSSVRSRYPPSIELIIASAATISDTIEVLSSPHSHADMVPISLRDHLKMNFAFVPI